MNPSPLQHSHGGLSPHTRGTPGSVYLTASRFRFIPAYAGNTEICSQTLPHPPVYPRIRGEHRLCAEQVPETSGLSPHTRGTQKRLFLHRHGSRFIPAYAGNTCRAVVGGLYAAVYPRIRGEHCYCMTAMPAPGGLSPHTRGTPKEQETKSVYLRFIPAYAGNTYDHP